MKTTLLTKNLLTLYNPLKRKKRIMVRTLGNREKNPTGSAIFPRKMKKQM